MDGHTGRRVQQNFAELKPQFLSTTGIGFDGYTVKKYLGVKNGEVVLGTGFLSEFSAAVSDVFGTANVDMANKLAEAKKASLDMFIEDCIYAGANAAISIDIDIMTLSNNMIVVSTTGTAVVIESL